MHTKKELDQLFEQTGLRPNKKLGQNFLVNPRIVQTIVDKSRDLVTSKNFKTVLEIGPGLGAITHDLQRLSTKLVLCEFDTGLVEYWKEKGLVVMPGDALRLEWNELVKEGILEEPALLVSNLPYQIAASLVMELCIQPHPFEALILMFQKEVAVRIAARTGQSEYGLLSVAAQCFWEVSRLVDAGPQDFHPVPNVGSRVLTFVRKESVFKAFDRRRYMAFLKAAFSQPRKKMISNLGAVYPQPLLLQIWQSQAHDINARAESLSPETFMELFTALEATGS